jgi:hypothetical protein
VPAGLHGLDSRARYEVTLDQSHEPTDKKLLSGKELSRLRVSIPPGHSVVIRYRDRGAPVGSEGSK